MVDALNLKEQADTLFMSRKYDTALAKYVQTHSILEHSNNPRLKTHMAAVSNNIANSYKKLNDWDKAIEWYKQGIQADATHPECLYNLANTYLQLDKSVLAEGYFRRALKSRPNFPEALMGLSGILRKNGSKKEPLEMLLKAMKLSPQSPEIRANLGLQYLAERNFVQATKHLKEAADMGFQPAKEQLEMLLKAMNKVKDQLSSSHAGNKKEDTSETLSPGDPRLNGLF